MTARQRRALRGAAATMVAVLLAAVSHTYGGGAAPGPGILVAVAAISWPLATLLAARRLGLAGIAAGAVLSQVLLHVAFAVTAGAAPVAASHHGMVMLTAGGPPLALADAPMLTAHAVAAVVAFALLAFGRRGLRAVARGVRTAFARLRFRARAPRHALPVIPLPRLSCEGPRRADLRRRGPPSSLALPAS